MKAINRTLLDALFLQKPEQPGENGRRRMYRSLYHRIFPGEGHFIEFLKSDTMDHQYRLAKEILRRLCFESNFSPPFSVFQDLVSIENSQKANRPSSKYIPRDHFLHIVYLYMLGIYIFFSDTVFYDSILEQYRYKRDAATSENMETGRAKDFISAWKYFCIYHDVGYSIEMHASEHWHTDVKKIEGFIKAFGKGKLKNHVLIETTIKIMTRLVFIRQLVDAGDTEIKKNHIFEKLGSEQVYALSERKITRGEGIPFKNVIGKFMAEKAPPWIGLKKIFSSRCLKPLLSLFSTEDFIILAFNADNGHPAFCSTPRDGGGHDLHEFASCGNHEEFQKIRENRGILFHDDFLSSTFEMQYFLKNDSEKFLIVGKIPVDSLNAAVEGVKKKFKDNFLKISDTNAFYNYQYSIYRYFIDDVFSQSSRESGALDMKRLDVGEGLLDVAASGKAPPCSPESIIFNFSLNAALNDKNINIATKFFEELLKRTEISNEDAAAFKGAHLQDPRAFIDKKIGVIKKSLTTFTENKIDFDAMTDDIADEVTRTMQSAFYFRQGAYQLFCAIAKEQKDMYQGFREVLSYNYHSAPGSRKLDSSMEYFMADVFKWLPSDFVNAKSTVKEILDDYAHPYGKTQDHGIVSAYCFAYLADMFRFAVHKKANGYPCLLALLWNIPPQHDILLKKCVTNYGHVIRDVFFSLLVHNLYPEHFKEQELKDYRTGIEEPFAFLALLCDTLQRWNRPHLMHPFDFDKRPNLDATEHYDILIENDTLAVYESADRRQQEQLRESLDALSAFLRQPQAFIREGFTKAR